MMKKPLSTPNHNINDSIVLQWVSTHNLKNIDVTIPKNKLITITGVSWSGKSSLAFHTIYKEGQFRYIESLSSYLRQFFSLWSRPDIEYTSWLSPAIAIEQNKHIGNSRSSVGTLTEIDDYLRLLYAKIGSIYSYGSGKQIKTQTVDQIVDTIAQHYMSQKVFLIQELYTCDEKKELDTFVKKNRNKVEKEKWFVRYLIKSIHAQEHPDAVEFFYLEDPSLPNDYFPVSLYGIYDRITIEETKLWRLKEDSIKILSEVKKFWVRQDQSDYIEWFTDKNYDPDCNISYPEFTPKHFSPNRIEGACPWCSGIGEILQVDKEKIIDPESGYMRAILPRRDSTYGQNILERLAQKYNIDASLKWFELPERFRIVVLEWDKEILRVTSGEKSANITYQWIEEILKDQYQKWLLTVDFQAMLSMEKCPECSGAKLRKESLHVFITLPRRSIKKEFLTILEHSTFHEPIVDEVDPDTIKINIAQIQQLPLEKIVELLELFIQYSQQSHILIERILHPLMDRAKTIKELWLWYISLHRQVGTLSGGEIQRLRLTKQLGNKLTGIIYVLDEPTIWLNKKEIIKVIEAIKWLQEMGNTIIVVEHNEEFIKASDWIVEIGPGAGDFGWKLIFNGSYQDFITQHSLTAEYITWRKKVHVNFEHTPQNKYIHIKNAHKYNLKNISVDIPLWSFTIITWWSGAGKTTLMYTTLFRFLEEKQKFIQSYIRLHLLKKWLSRQEIIAAPVMKKEEYSHYENLALMEFYKDLGVDIIQGHQEIDNTIYIDQSSIGKTPRSCPATFVGIFDDMRILFAGTNEAKYLWFNSGHFSFNSTKWACPECNWYGYKKIELQFLPDTYIPCELCHGTRYKPEVNQITRRWKSISQILDMYIKDAYTFFEDIRHIADPLWLMIDIGLWYLKLGQPAQMLSWGESQRLKLVKHFLKSYKWHTVYFLDEPTVWLHPHDIEKLLLVLQRFLNKGDTILMIEHDEDLLQFADHIITLDNGKLI